VLTQGTRRGESREFFNAIPDMQIEGLGINACALRSYTTDARKAAVRCFGRSDRRAQRPVPWYNLMEAMEGSREPPSNWRQPAYGRGTGRRPSCRFTWPLTPRTPALTIDRDRL
jgi:hypothetical protein